MPWPEDPENDTIYIRIGGAAEDVNAGDGTIDADKITAHTITADQIFAHTITADEIFAHTITADEIKAGAITADKLSASYITVGGAAGDINGGVTTIDGGKLTADTVTADHIVAATLTIDKLCVGLASGNLITNGSFESGVLFPATLEVPDASATFPVLASNPKSGTYTLRYAPTGSPQTATAYVNCNGDPTNHGKHNPVISGRKYTFECQVFRPSTSSPVNAMRLYHSWRNANGSVISTTYTGFDPNTFLPDTWTRCVSIKAAPETAAYCVYRLAVLPNGYPGTLDFDDLAALCQMDVHSIEAGSIGTDHLQAGSITADKISVNSLSALAVTTGALTVDDTLTMGADSLIDMNDNGTLQANLTTIDKTGIVITAPENFDPEAGIRWYSDGDLVGSLTGARGNQADKSPGELYLRTYGGAHGQGIGGAWVQAQGSPAGQAAAGLEASSKNDTNGTYTSLVIATSDDKYNVAHIQLITKDVVWQPYGGLIVSHTRPTPSQQPFLPTTARDGEIASDSAEFGGPTHYSRFATNGLHSMVGDARPWRDEIGDLLSAKKAGSAITEDLTDGTVAFPITCDIDDDWVILNLELNHDWDHAVGIKPHLHWLQAASDVPNWLLKYRWQKIGYAAATNWLSLAASSEQYTYSSGTLNQVSIFPTIAPPANSAISNIIQLRLFRDISNASTRFAGSDPLNATASALMLDFHLRLNSIGSASEFAK